MILLELFWAFLTIGVVAFGGGYAMLPLFERVMVTDQGWLSAGQFIDMIAISQVTPGPIAINSATFIGYEVAGVLGAAVGTVGVIFMPVVFIGIVSFYAEEFKTSRTVKAILKGLRPALVGLILASVYSVAQTAIVDVRGVLLFFVLLFLLMKIRLHPILVIVISGLIGMLLF